MRQSKNSHRLCAFALYEVLIGVTIFVVGVLVLGRAVENCLNASILSTDEDRVRQILANRMAEVQATPGTPKEKDEKEIKTGYGVVKIVQRSVPARLKNEKDVELTGLMHITITAEWKRGSASQSRMVEFYVYRAG